MDHFVVCAAYGVKTEENWKEIFENNTERQIEIGHLCLKQAQPKMFYSPKVDDGVEICFFTS